MNEELDEFIKKTMYEFMNDGYKIYNSKFLDIGEQKWIESRGYGYIIRIFVDNRSILATAWADNLKEDNYFVFEYLKTEKKILGYGNFKKFAKEMENIFTLDCLGAL